MLLKKNYLYILEIIWIISIIDHYKCLSTLEPNIHLEVFCCRIADLTTLYITGYCILCLLLFSCHWMAYGIWCTIHNTTGYSFVCFCVLFCIYNAAVVLLQSAFIFFYCRRLLKGYFDAGVVCKDILCKLYIYTKVLFTVSKFAAQYLLAGSAFPPP